jgi:nucleoside-diphosphate kinase
MVLGDKDEVLGFLAEWYDPRPQLKRKFLLKYYSATHDAEMIEVEKHRCFLKRSKLPSTVFPSDFSVGSQVLIYGRELKILDYADPLTRTKLAPKSEATSIWITPSQYGSAGAIVSDCEANGYMVMKLKTIDNGDGIGLAVSLKGPKAVTGTKDLLSKYGGGVLCAESAGDVETMEGQYFGSTETTATLDSCTCVVIKPHAVKAKVSGDIISTIMAQGYEISAMQTFILERASASEFLEVYKGVVQDYSTHVDEFTTGIVIAMEVRAEDAVSTFRSTAGPWDVEMAKELYPKSIRGKHGVDNIRNAVHCTDLPEDGQSECEYFFDLLQN